METIEIIEGINDAIKILDVSRGALSGGSQAIWNLAYHATKHLDKQITDLLAPSSAE
jgi:hypothetical protein